MKHQCQNCKKWSIGRLLTFQYGICHSTGTETRGIGGEICPIFRLHDNNELKEEENE